MMNSFMKIAGKIGAQKHLVAIRDAFVAMLPLTMAGSVAVLLNVFFRDIPNNLGWTSFSEAMKPLIELNGYVYFGTIAVMALIFAFALGYNRAQHEKVNPIAGGLVAFGAFVKTWINSFTRRWKNKFRNLSVGCYYNCIRRSYRFVYSCFHWPNFF